VAKDAQRELWSLLRQMDVPKERKYDNQRDWLWLMRNLGIRNGNNPKYHVTMAVLRELLQIGY